LPAHDIAAGENGTKRFHPQPFLGRQHCLDAAVGNAGHDQRVGVHEQLLLQPSDRCFHVQVRALMQFDVVFARRRDVAFFFAKLLLQIYDPLPGERPCPRRCGTKKT
jgi:hypothetical protein